MEAPIKKMKTESISIKKSALLVIDMQRYFLESGARAFLDPPTNLIPNVSSLISAFRKSNRQIVFTRHAHTKGEATGQMGRWWDEELPWNGDEDSELIDGIVPRSSEIILTKTRYSAFEETELDQALKRFDVDTVVICGVMTNLCVETSARHAFMKNFRVVVVDDACATKSEEYHRASLLNLSYGFANIEQTDTIVKEIRNSKSQAPNSK